jgi:hypothetical protein
LDEELDLNAGPTVDLSIQGSGNLVVAEDFSAQTFSAINSASEIVDIQQLSQEICDGAVRQATRPDRRLAPERNGVFWADSAATLFLLMGWSSNFGLGSGMEERLVAADKESFVWKFIRLRLPQE